jgi:Mg2+ and Co2+ transporter CorA
VRSTFGWSQKLAGFRATVRAVATSWRVNVGTSEWAMVVPPSGLMGAINNPEKMNCLSLKFRNYVASIESAKKHSVAARRARLSKCAGDGLLNNSALIFRLIDAVAALFFDSVYWVGFRTK